MPTVNQSFEIRDPRPYTITNLKAVTDYQISSKELVGIEVEVEDVERAKGVHEVWVSKQDGSLRNNGIEFVTYPIPACDSVAALDNLMGVLEKRCCFSPRTSVHVHLDYSQNQLEDVFNTLIVYSMFERLFYKFVGRQRIKNIFCVPLTDTNLLTAAANQGIRPTVWQKYTGLNLKPLAQFGTIEFRHMHGTLDVRKLAIWIDLITRMKEYCLKTGSKKLRGTVAALDDLSDFRALLADVFGNAADYLKYESFEDIRYTYPQAKMMLTKPAGTLQTLQREFSDQSPMFKVKV